MVVFVTIETNGKYRNCTTVTVNYKIYIHSKNAFKIILARSGAKINSFLCWHRDFFPMDVFSMDEFPMDEFPTRALAYKISE